MEELQIYHSPIFGNIRIIRRMGNATATARTLPQSWPTVITMMLSGGTAEKKDALLQKTYILDCIDKRAVKNNGGLPMYLVKDAHEGIVSREVFELVQQEIARRSGKRKVSDRTVTESAKYSGKYGVIILQRLWHSVSPLHLA